MFNLEMLYPVIPAETALDIPTNTTFPDLGLMVLRQTRITMPIKFIYLELYFIRVI
jgi:hypothetical protein